MSGDTSFTGPEVTCVWKQLSADAEVNRMFVFHFQMVLPMAATVKS